MVRRAALTAIAVAAAAAVSATGLAQEPPREYAAIIEDAVDEFDDGRWAEARAHFERAHALFPNARTLRGIGMCAFELQDYPDAVRFLDRALGDARRALTDAQRVETEALLARARTYVGHFLFTTRPPGAELRIDDEVPAIERDGRVTLSVGVHAVVVRAPGHREARRRLEVGGGEDREIAIELPPSGLGSPPLVSVALFVAGGAALLVEPFSIGWWVDRDGAIASCASPPAGLRCDNAHVLAEQRDAAIATSVAAAATGLALAAVGLVFWLAGEGSAGEEDALACGPGPGGVGCRF